MKRKRNVAKRKNNEAAVSISQTATLSREPIYFREDYSSTKKTGRDKSPAIAPESYLSSLIMDVTSTFSSTRTETGHKAPHENPEVLRSIVSGPFVVMHWS